MNTQYRSNELFLYVYLKNQINQRGWRESIMFGIRNSFILQSIKNTNIPSHFLTFHISYFSTLLTILLLILSIFPCGRSYAYLRMCVSYFLLVISPPEFFFYSIIVCHMKFDIFIEHDFHKNSSGAFNIYMSYI